MKVRLAGRLAGAAVVGVALLSSCGSRGGGGGGFGGSSFGRIVPAPDPLNLSGTGAVYAGTIAVTDNGYSGTVSISTTCSSGNAPVASISPTSASGPSFNVTVTPQNAGSCTITYSDSNGLSRSSTVNVSTAGIGVSSRSRR